MYDCAAKNTIERFQNEVYGFKIRKIDGSFQECDSPILHKVKSLIKCISPNACYRVWNNWTVQKTCALLCDNKCMIDGVSSPFVSMKHFVSEKSFVKPSVANDEKLLWTCYNPARTHFAIPFLRISLPLPDVAWPTLVFSALRRKDQLSIVSRSCRNSR